MEKITSFTIDHIRLVPGVYVSRVDAVAGHPVTTFDLRMTAPNDEPVMNTAEMHTIEHLAADISPQPRRIQRQDSVFRPYGMPHRILSAVSRRIYIQRYRTFDD